MQRFNKSQAVLIAQGDGHDVVVMGGMESLSGEDYHLSPAPFGRCGALSPNGNAYHVFATTVPC